MKEFNLHDFAVDIYAAASPTVDYNTATALVPWDHTIESERYEEIVKKHCGARTEYMREIIVFMLNNGPKVK